MINYEVLRELANEASVHAQHIAGIVGVLSRGIISGTEEALVPDQVAALIERGEFLCDELKAAADGVKSEIKS